MKTLNATEMANVSDAQVEAWDAREALMAQRAQLRLLGAEPSQRAPRRVKPNPLFVFVPPTTRPATWRDVVTEVSRATSISSDLILRPTGEGTRLAPVVRARYLAAWALRLRKQSYHQIGKWLGGRDHSTVIYGITKLKRNATLDERALVRRLAGK